MSGTNEVRRLDDNTLDHYVKFLEANGLTPKQQGVNLGMSHTKNVAGNDVDHMPIIDTSGIKLSGIKMHGLEREAAVGDTEEELYQEFAHNSSQSVMRLAQTGATATTTAPTIANSLRLSEGLFGVGSPAQNGAGFSPTEDYSDKIQEVQALGSWLAENALQMDDNLWNSQLEQYINLRNSIKAVMGQMPDALQATAQLVDRAIAIRTARNNNTRFTRVAADGVKKCPCGEEIPSNQVLCGECMDQAQGGRD